MALALRSVTLDAVPWLAVTYDELRAMPLTSRHMAIVARVDGCATVAMLADMSGLERADAIALLAELTNCGALTFRAR